MSFSRELFKRLDKSDRDALIVFLNLFKFKMLIRRVIKEKKKTDTNET